MILMPELTVRNCKQTREVDEGYELMLQVNDPVKVVRECSSTRVMRRSQMMVCLERN